MDQFDITNEKSYFAIEHPRAAAAVDLSKTFAVAAKETIAPDITGTDLLLNALMAVNPIFAMAAPGILERKDEIISKTKKFFLGEQELLEQQSELLEAQNVKLDKQSESLEDIDNLAKETVSKLDDLQQALVESEPIDLSDKSLDKIKESNKEVVEAIKTSTKETKSIIEKDRKSFLSKFVKSSITLGTVISGISLLKKYYPTIKGKVLEISGKPKVTPKQEAETGSKVQQEAQEKVKSQQKFETLEKLTQTLKDTSSYLYQSVEDIGKIGKGKIENIKKKLSEIRSQQEVKTKESQEVSKEEVKTQEKESTQSDIQKTKIFENLVKSVKDSIENLREENKILSNIIDKTKKIKESLDTSIDKLKVKLTSNIKRVKSEFITKQKETLEKNKESKVSKEIQEPNVEEAKEKVQKITQEKEKSLQEEVVQKVAKTVEKTIDTAKQTLNDSVKRVSKTSNKFKEKLEKRYSDLTQTVLDASHLFSLLGKEKLATGLRFGAFLKRGETSSAVLSLAYLTPLGPLLSSIELVKPVVQSLMEKRKKEDKSLEETAKTTKEKVVEATSSLTSTISSGFSSIQETITTFSDLVKKKFNDFINKSAKDSEKYTYLITKQFVGSIFADAFSRLHHIKVLTGISEGSIGKILWGMTGFKFPVIYYTAETIKFIVSSAFKFLEKSPGLIKDTIVMISEVIRETIKLSGKIVRNIIRGSIKSITLSKDLAFGITKAIYNGIKQSITGTFDLITGRKESIKEAYNLKTTFFDNFIETIKRSFNIKELKLFGKTLYDNTIGTLISELKKTYHPKSDFASELGEVVHDEVEKTKGSVQSAFQTLRKDFSSLKKGFSSILKSTVSFLTGWNLEKPEKSEEVKIAEEQLKVQKAQYELQKKTAEKQGLLQEETVEEIKQQTKQSEKQQSFLFKIFSLFKKWKAFQMFKSLFGLITSPFTKAASMAKDVFSSMMGGFAGTALGGSIGKVLRSMFGSLGKAGRWIIKGLSSLGLSALMNPEVIAAIAVTAFTVYEVTKLADTISDLIKNKLALKHIKENEKTLEQKFLSEKARAKYGVEVTGRPDAWVEAYNKGELILAKGPDKEPKYFLRTEKIPEGYQIIDNTARNLKQEVEKPTHKPREVKKQETVKEVSLTRTVPELRSKEKQKIPESLQEKVPTLSESIKEGLKDKKVWLSLASLAAIKGIPENNVFGKLTKFTLSPIGPVTVPLTATGIIKGIFKPEREYWKEKAEEGFSVWDVLSPYRWGLNTVEGVKFLLHFKEHQKELKDLKKSVIQSNLKRQEIDQEMISRLSDQAFEYLKTRLEASKSPTLTIVSALKTGELIKGSDNKFHIPTENDIFVTPKQEENIPEKEDIQKDLLKHMKTLVKHTKETGEKIVHTSEQTTKTIAAQTTQVVNNISNIVQSQSSVPTIGDQIELQFKQVREYQPKF